MFRGLDWVAACGIPVHSDYIPNTVAFADMSNNSIDGVFRCVTALFGFIGFGRIFITLSGSWPSFGALFILLTCTTIVDEHRTLCASCSFCTVGRYDVVHAVFVEDE